MPKTDLIRVYEFGMSTDGEPSEIRTREECRAWKNSGEGRFDQHGDIFMFYKAKPIELDTKSTYFGAVRGRSVKVDGAKPYEPMQVMELYAANDKKAVAIVNSYRGIRHTIKEMAAADLTVAMAYEPDTEAQADRSMSRTEVFEQMNA